MNREEVASRYKRAQLAAMAQMAEHQPDQAEQQTDNEPAGPTLAQIMGVGPYKDVGPGITEDDRLRRWAGLK